MIRRTKRWLLYAGLNPEEFNVLLPKAWHENRKKLKIYALVSVGVFFCLAIASLATGLFSEKGIAIYGIMVLYNAAFYILARFFAKDRPHLTTLLCFLFIAGLYAFAIINSAIYRELPAVTAIAFLLLGPFLFTECPVHLIGMNVTAAGILCVLSYSVKSPETAAIDLCNALVFGFLSIVAEIMQESIHFQLLHQSNQIRFLSETDMLTGCKNRNCYQARLSGFPEQCKKELICVYIDVNGLHNLNDDKGHDAGDVMLQTVASSLLDAFGAEHTYRIGGDEFVVIRMDASEEETRQILTRISNELSVQGYDISIGVGFSGKPINMPDLIHSAEQEMYLFKKAYYDQPGHTRRRCC